MRKTAHKYAYLSNQPKYQVHLHIISTVIFEKNKNIQHQNDLYATTTAFDTFREIILHGFKLFLFCRRRRIEQAEAKLILILND